MDRFSAMDAAAFNDFRVFYASKTCPFKGKLAGPSGLYSAKVPTLDLLMAGEHLPAHLREFVLTHGEYYPQSDAAKSFDGRRGASVLDAIHHLGDPEQLATDYAHLQQALAGFRRAHSRAVVAFLPEVVQAKQAGTGGEGIQLLRARNAMHGEAISKCPFHKLAGLINRVRGAR